MSLEQAERGVMNSEVFLIRTIFLRQSFLDTIELQFFKNLNLAAAGSEWTGANIEDRTREIVPSKV